MAEASAVSVEVSQALARAPTTDALWSAALLDLWFEHDDSRTIDRVIGRLIEVRAREAANPLVLNDLAIAHLIRASSRDDAADLFASLDYVERAYEIDSSSSVIRFNRAVILERARIDLQAASAWAAFAIDSSGPWSAEAGRRHAQLTSPERRSHLTPALLDAARTGDSVAITLLIRQDPQTAREYALDTLVPRWSRALIAGDSATALASLRDAVAIGRALLAFSGDSSVMHATSGIAVEGGSRASRIRQAAAVAQAADGIAKFRQARFLEAEPELRTASKELRATGAPALANWAEVLLAGVRIQRADYASAERLLVAIAVAAKRRGDIALEARSRWALALSQGRRGAARETEASYRVALANFARLGETSNYGFMQALVADIHHALGRSAAHAHAMYAALDAFHQRADPGLRYSVLLALGQRLSDRGLGHAALVAIREAVLIAPSTGRTKDVPEALGRLAHQQAVLGDLDGARISLAAADAGLRAIADPVMRSRLVAEIARAKVTAFERQQPQLALSHLDGVVAYFAVARVPTDHAPALTKRATLRLAIGDSTGALGDLDLATKVLGTLVSARSDRQTIRRLVETQRDIFKRLVAVSLARGDRAGAYRYAELSRADTLMPKDSHARPAAEIGSDEATLSYLTLDDRLLIWTSRRGGRLPQLTEVPVRAEELNELVMRFINLLRQEGDERLESEMSRQLYKLLIAPVSSRLTGARHLRLATDESTSDVPFAALRDSDNRYVIEGFSLAYVGQSLGSSRRDRGSRRAARAPLLVADPAWEPSLFPDLEQLRNARLEVEGIRAFYSRATVLTGAAASRASLLRGLLEHDLVHFAGHARVARGEPASSHLVLARDKTDFAANVLFASDIARLNLGGVQLVVLSACGGTRDRYAGSTRNGLVDALLDAGVGAVIASQWEADDEGTAVLMRRLHRELSAGVHPSEALRRAQLSLLSRSARRSNEQPSARVWATFRVHLRSG